MNETIADDVLNAVEAARMPAIQAEKPVLAQSGRWKNLSIGRPLTPFIKRRMQAEKLSVVA